MSAQPASAPPASAGTAGGNHADGPRPQTEARAPYKPAGERAVRLAFVGAGGWMSRYHLPAAGRLQERGEITMAGIWNRTPEKAARLAEAFSIPRVYESLAELCADPDLDGIVVVVSRVSVYEVMMQLAGSRCPLFVEKPPGDTPQQAEQLAETFGTRCMVGFNRRFVAFHERFAELVEAAPEVHLVECRFTRRGRDDPRFVTESGVHSVNFLEWLLGPITDLQADRYPDPEGGWLHWRATVRFSSGPTGHLVFLPRSGYACEHYTVHARNRSLTLECATPYSDDSENRIIIREQPHRPGSQNAPKVTVLTDDTEDELERGGFMDEYREFVALVRSGRPSSSGLYESVSSVRISHAIERGGGL